MWQFAKKLLRRFPAVAAKSSWQVFAGIALILGFLEGVNKSIQQQLLNTPNWSLVLLVSAIFVYTVFATAYEESKDRADSEKAEVGRGVVETVATFADSAKESAIAYKFSQNTIDGLRTDLKEANDKLNECMKENADLREESAGLKSPEDG